MHTVVLVLGDLGRSPRMQYHAVSLSKLKRMHVTLVGYQGERCIAGVEQAKNIRQYRFSPMVPLPRALFLLYAPFKVLFQILQLFWILLLGIESFQAILVQNPPSIPTLFVVWTVSRLRGAKFLIDWHNLGYTVLGLALGEQHLFVKFSKWYEGVFARTADGHFCVTKEMKKWLRKTWKIKATVLYDKPPQFFKPATVEEQHELFTRLANEFGICKDFVVWNEKEDQSLMTTKAKSSSHPMLRKDKPALIISSTSWTEDEDFSILLNALVEIAKKVEKMEHFPNLVVVVTGKGPQKERYVQEINKLNPQFRRIRIITMWLEAADYPILLGCADLGISLHFSTSGRDLPMKVLDMFGCGVPACAINFKCLHELVHHERNGMVFNDSRELASQIITLLQDYPNNTKLRRLQQGLKNMERWSSNWNRNAAPIFNRICSEKYD